MKINWVGHLLVPDGTEERNMAASKTLGLPVISQSERPILAVVGGGPSVAAEIGTLRGWPGDIWASGSCFPWCLANGIDATFFTIDQHPSLVNDCKGAKRAILATACDPGVFAELKDADIQVFDLVHSGEHANHAATSVTACMKIALDMGYREIHFFGCDSSINGSTHAYYNDKVDPFTLLLERQSFNTWASMLMQAEFMAIVMRAAPNVYVNRSKGLLEAMVKAKDPLGYDITHITHALADKLGIPMEQRQAA